MSVANLFASYLGTYHSDFSLDEVEADAVHYDSRHIKPGSIFVAVAGSKANGADFIDAAVEAGAVALVVAEDVELPASAMSVSVIRVDAPRRALSHLAAAFNPTQPESIAAVTGTDGKTSTVHFLRQIWEQLGHKAASIGTLGFIGEGGTKLVEGSHTTPDPIGLHAHLESLTDQGYSHVAVEASSHGLDQHRLDGLGLFAAAFTNLTREHLDYHHDMEHYFQAKARLFSELLPAHGTAVLNVEDPYSERLSAMAKEQQLKVVEYGEEAKDLRIIETQPLADGQRAELVIYGKQVDLHTPLVGSFQIYNMLAAMGIAMANGADAADVLAILPKLEPVPGRLERVALHKTGAGVYIDYAHTPGALEKALEALRHHTSGRLIVVFGAGGDRDKTKRPKMGEAAAHLADLAIVTDDNPRTENPDIIRKEILAACPEAKEIGDRKQAIDKAISMLQAGDNLLVAGKGHETVQIIGDQQHPFDDAAVIKEVIAV